MEGGSRHQLWDFLMYCLALEGLFPKRQSRYYVVNSKQANMLSHCCVSVVRDYTVSLPQLSFLLCRRGNSHHDSNFGSLGRIGMRTMEFFAQWKASQCSAAIPSPPLRCVNCFPGTWQSLRTLNTICKSKDEAAYTCIISGQSGFDLS